MLPEQVYLELYIPRRSSRATRPAQLSGVRALGVWAVLTEPGHYAQTWFALPREGVRPVLLQGGFWGVVMLI